MFVFAESCYYDATFNYFVHYFNLCLDSKEFKIACIF